MAEFDHMEETPDEEANREYTARVVAATARAYARREADSRLKRYRNQALVGFLVLVAGIGYSLHQQHQTSADARQVVCQIITRGDQQAYIYRDEGTITTAQLNRALQQSAKDRELLNAGCNTSITPPPRHVKTAQPGPAATPAPHAHGQPEGR